MNKRKLFARKQAFDSRKIPVRVDREQWHELGKIQSDFKFKSRYEIMQYILSCFLKAVKVARNDPDAEPVSEEIEAMFSDLSQAERHFEYIKPKRRMPQRQIDEANGQGTLDFKYD